VLLTWPEAVHNAERPRNGNPLAVVMMRTVA
jgi:hypothetical protein